MDRVAEARCDDTRCLKRRGWEYDADTPLDADCVDGDFPCPLVIAAAWRWTRPEAERS